MELVTLEVTQPDIDAALALMPKGSFAVEDKELVPSHCCPISQAVMRQLDFPAVSTGMDGDCLDRHSGKKIFDVGTPGMREFIRRFDRTGEAEPTTFKLEVLWRG